MDVAEPLPEAADERHVEVAERVDAPTVELAEAVGRGQLRPAVAVERPDPCPLPRAAVAPDGPAVRVQDVAVVPLDRDPVAGGQVLERAPRRRPVLIEEAPGRGQVPGAAADVAVARLVERVVAEHVVEVRDALGQRGHGADVAVLQLLLHAGQLGAEGVAAVEQRPHGGHGHPLVVLAPVLRVEADRPGLDEVLGSQSHQVEAPERARRRLPSNGSTRRGGGRRTPRGRGARPGARPRRSSRGRPRRTRPGRRARWPPTW